MIFNIHRPVQPSPQSVLEHFQSPTKTHSCNYQLLPIFSSPQPLATTDQISVSMDLPILIISFKRNHIIM